MNTSTTVCRRIRGNNQVNDTDQNSKLRGYGHVSSDIVSVNIPGL